MRSDIQSQKPYSNTLILSPDKADLLKQAAVGMVPAVQVELIGDPELAANAHAATASYETRAGEGSYRGSDWAQTARQAVLDGRVLVRFTRYDGIGDLSPLYERADELAAKEVPK